MDIGRKTANTLSLVWVCLHFMAFLPTLFLWGVFGWSGVLASIAISAPTLVPFYMKHRERMYRSFKPVVPALEDVLKACVSLLESLFSFARQRGSSVFRS